MGRGAKITNKDKYLKEGISGNDIFNLSQALGEYLTIKCRAENVFVSDISTFFALKLKTQPTLTEDERVILRNIKNEEYNGIIGREDDTTYQVGKLYLKSKYSDAKAFAFSTLYNHLFQFIKEGEEYSIKELLGDEEQ